MRSLPDQDGAPVEDIVRRRKARRSSTSDASIILGALPIDEPSARRHSSFGTALKLLEPHTVPVPGDQFSVPTRFYAPKSTGIRRANHESPFLETFRRIGKAALQASVEDGLSLNVESGADTDLASMQDIPSADVKTWDKNEGIAGKPADEALEKKREPRAPRIISDRRVITTAHALTERAMAVASNTTVLDEDDGSELPSPPDHHPILPTHRESFSMTRGSLSVQKGVGGAVGKQIRARAVSIDVAAPYMVDTSNGRVFLGWQNGVISPYSLLVSYTVWTLRLIWCYTALAVPFELCFLDSSELHTVFIGFDMAFDVLFIGCVLILLFTAVSLKGELITDRSTLVKMYTKSSFIPDLISILPLFLDAYLMSMWITTSLTTRLLRSLRICRLLSKRQHDMSDNGLIGVVAMSMFVAHLLACGYIAFSVIGTHEEDGWKIETYVLSQDLLHQYLHALTWSLDIMTGFRETPTPQSDFQYLFTTLTFLIGTFLFAYVIGRTGDWVSRRTARKENLDLRLTIMEQFIATHEIPDELGQDLLEFYRYTWESMRGFDATSVLNTLPVCIGVDVSSFIYQTHLSKVEFFERMPASVVSELAKRMGMIVRSPGEKIMAEGQTPFGICFINFGVVDVIPRRGTKSHSLRRGEMFGDEILRSQAVVSCSYIARTFCQLYVLEVSDVAAVLAAFPVEAAFMAKMTKGKGIQKGRPSRTEVSKLSMPFQLPLFSYRSNVALALSIVEDTIALYNAFAVLFRIGFDVESPSILVVLSLDALADLGAALCIIARFHEQHARYGELITSRWDTALKYLKGYFILDAMALLPLHFIQIFNPLFRLPRLLGLIRYRFAKQRLTANSTLQKLSRQIIYFTLITHLVSCCYFGIVKVEGYADTDDDFLPGPSAQNASFFVQYSIATLHSLKILTGRGNKPQGLPHSVVQLLFLIISSMFGMFGVAFLIGEVGVLVAHFNPLRFIHQADVDNINHFMKYKKFPLSLQQRVRSYLAYRWECTHGIGLKEAIADLPKALRVRVLEHITLRFVRQVPMFSNLSESLIQSILECFEYMSIPAHEYVYRKSEMGSNMYIILDGVVALGHSGHEPALMGPGSFFGEEAILNKIGLRDTSVQTYTGCTLGTLTADALEAALEAFNEEEHLKAVEELASHHHDSSDFEDQRLMDTLNCLSRDSNFFSISVESPVSTNLHTGKEIVAFIRKELKCNEAEASELTDKLLLNGNLRPLGILSPTTHLGASKRNDAAGSAPSSPHDGTLIDLSSLYRLVDFRITSNELFMAESDATLVATKPLETASNDTKVSDLRLTPSRASLNKSQTLLLKTSSGKFSPARL